MNQWQYHKWLRILLIFCKHIDSIHKHFNRCMKECKNLAARWITESSFSSSSLAYLHPFIHLWYPRLNQDENIIWNSFANVKMRDRRMRRFHKLFCFLSRDPTYFWSKWRFISNSTQRCIFLKNSKKECVVAKRYLLLCCVINVFLSGCPTLSCLKLHRLRL